MKKFALFVLMVVVSINNVFAQLYVGETFNLIKKPEEKTLLNSNFHPSPATESAVGLMLGHDFGFKEKSKWYWGPEFIIKLMRTNEVHIGLKGKIGYELVRHLGIDFATGLNYRIPTVERITKRERFVPEFSTRLQWKTIFSELAMTKSERLICFGISVYLFQNNQEYD